MKAKDMFEKLGFNKCEIIEKKGEYGECYPIEIKYYNNPDTISQDNENGYNNYIGNDGDILNGKTDN